MKVKEILAELMPNKCESFIYPVIGATGLLTEHPVAAVSLIALNYVYGRVERHEAMKAGGPSFIYRLPNERYYKFDGAGEVYALEHNLKELPDE